MLKKIYKMKKKAKPEEKKKIQKAKAVAVKQPKPKSKPESKKAKTAPQEEKPKKPKKAKVSDIVAGERLFEDLYPMGWLKKSEDPKRREFDMSWQKQCHFSRMPDHLVVTKETPVGTRVWIAKDFFDGKRRNFYTIKKHRPPMGRELVDTVELEDQDRRTRIMFFDQVCIVPTNHKTSQKMTDDQHLEELKWRQKKKKEKTDLTTVLKKFKKGKRDE